MSIFMLLVLGVIANYYRNFSFHLCIQNFNCSCLCSSLKTIFFFELLCQVVIILQYHPSWASLLYVSESGYPGVVEEHFLRLLFMRNVNRIAISLMTVYNSASTFSNFFPLSSKAIFPFVH